MGSKIQILACPNPELGIVWFRLTCPSYTFISFDKVNVHVGLNPKSSHLQKGEVKLNYKGPKNFKCYHFLLSYFLSELWIAIALFNSFIWRRLKVIFLTIQIDRQNIKS